MKKIEAKILIDSIFLTISVLVKHQGNRTSRLRKLIQYECQTKKKSNLMKIFYYPQRANPIGRKHETKS